MSLSVAWQNPQHKNQALLLSKHLGLPLHSEISSSPQLFVSDQGLMMKLGHSRLFVDFVKGSLGYRRRHGGGLKQAIARAVGLKTRKDVFTVLDATAGLGKDAFVLACLGCDVRLVERAPVIAALLEDGLARAMAEPELQDIIQRMHLIQSDAKIILQSLSTSDCPDVVYLDPMFPHWTRNALTKIDLRFIRDIVGEDLDAEELLPLGLEKARRRVVVKRPISAPPIAGFSSPDFVVEGKKNRYDVYLTGGQYKNS